jgi:hypothetical protein
LIHLEDDVSIGDLDDGSDPVRVAAHEVNLDGRARARGVGMSGQTLAKIRCVEHDKRSLANID